MDQFLCHALKHEDENPKKLQTCASICADGLKAQVAPIIPYNRPHIISQFSLRARLVVGQILLCCCAGPLSRQQHEPSLTKDNLGHNLLNEIVLRRYSKVMDRTSVT